MIPEKICHFRDEAHVDFLKKVLKIAIQDGSESIRIQVGKGVSLIGNGQEKSIPPDVSIDAAYMAKLYGFLFPNDKQAIASQLMTKGILNIPGVGKLNLIAMPHAPEALRLYTPKGTNLFESDWTKLNSKTVSLAPGMPNTDFDPKAVPNMFGASAPAKPAPAATPPPPPMAGSGFIPSFMTGAPDIVVSKQHRAPESIPMSIPMAMPTPIASPFVPSAPIPGPSMPPPIVMAPIAPIAPIAPMAASAPIPIQVDHSNQEEDPFAIDYGNIEIKHSGSADAEHAPVPLKKLTINFGGDNSSKGEVSDGQNPIDNILKEMVKRKASDVHMTCEEPICFRIDGDIVRLDANPVSPEEMERYIIPIMPRRNLEEFAEISDTDFAYEIRGLARFRVNVFRDKNGVGTVMRQIPSKILTAEQLNLPPVITKFCYLSKGLVVVTGPTGSGKSTTLAAMIDLINKTRTDHILTIEDPVEFVHPQQKCLVNQREVGKHTKSFARALKAALREDPDIVLIGEMRDLETIAIAIETAETGHLVFGTLHTTTAVSTVDRIIDQFPSDRQEQIRMMLSSSLRGVVAQTLLKKKGGGRIAAHEILVTNDAVSAMIREGKNHMIGNHMTSQKLEGNQMLNEGLTKLVKENIVDPEEAYLKSVDKNALLDSFKRHGIKYEGPKIPAPGGKVAS
jgi:twitching motility protein PilT